MERKNKKKGRMIDVDRVTWSFSFVALLTCSQNKQKKMCIALSMIIANLVRILTCHHDNEDYKVPG